MCLQRDQGKLDREIAQERLALEDGKVRRKAVIVGCVCGTDMRMRVTVTPSLRASECNCKGTVWQLCLFGRE